MTPSGDMWAASTARIINSLLGQEVAGADVLPFNDIPDLAEDWARQFVLENPDRDLRLALPALWGVTSAATEGAFYTLMPRERLMVPLVIQYIGLASSGTGKSSTLNRLEPLINGGLAAGKQWRESWAREVLEKLRAASGPGELDEAVTVELLGKSLCPRTLTHGGTPEGIRDNLVHGGAHRFIFTDEADAFQDLDAYNDRAVSITILCRGWDQGDIRVDRAAKDGKLPVIEIDKASLPVVMLVQQDVFNTATTHDVWISKGALARMFLMVGKDSVIPERYEGGDGDDVEDWDSGRGIPLMDFPVLEALKALSVRGSLSRARRAIDKHLDDAAAKMQNVDQLVSYLAASASGRIQLGWTGAGRAVHNKVQQQRLDILNAIQKRAHEDGAEPPGLNAYAFRYTQHVYRIAMARTLLDDPKATMMRAEHIEDTAVRIMPWLTAGWAQVMAGRAGQAQDAAVGEVFKNNPRGEDRSPERMIWRALGTYQDKNDKPYAWTDSWDKKGQGLIARKDFLDQACRTGGKDRTKLRAALTPVFNQMIEDKRYFTPVRTDRFYRGEPVIVHQLTFEGVELALEAIGQRRA